MKFNKPIAKGREAWSNEEEHIINKMINQGKTLKEIKKSLPHRSPISLKAKIRRMRFKQDKYGSDHRKEKYDLTRKWLVSIKPEKVFEGFAGEGKSTLIYLESDSVKEIHSCEINKKVFDKLLKNLSKKLEIKFKKMEKYNLNVFFGKYNGKNIFLVNEDSQKWAARLYSYNKTFDFLDLDTCGTVLPSLNNYLKIIRNGYFLLTLGEFHSYRFGRKDALIKSNPLMFKELTSNKNSKKVTVDEFYNGMIAWIYLVGSQTISYNELREINLKEKVILGKGICRVFFSVKKADSLAKILNNTSSYLKAN